jgi:hypothetical protein
VTFPNPCPPIKRRPNPSAPEALDTASEENLALHAGVEVTRAPALRRAVQVAGRRVLQCALRGEYDVWPLFSGGAHGLDHLRGGVSYLLEELAKVSTRVSLCIPSKLTEYGSPAVGRDSLQVLAGAVVVIQVLGMMARELVALTC